MGDRIRLRSGDVVPADARLVEAVALQVDESALTGESLPVDKATGAEVSAGTVVLGGRAEAVVVRTGVASATGQIAQLIGVRGPATPLQLQMRSLSRTLTVVTAIALQPAPQLSISSISPLEGSCKNSE